MNESLQSLKQWHKLLEDGIISQEEFDAKKNEILGISTNYQNNFEETKKVLVSEELISEKIVMQSVAKPIQTNYKKTPKKKASLNANQIFLIVLGSLLLIGGGFWFLQSKKSREDAKIEISDSTLVSNQKSIDTSNSINKVQDKENEVVNSKIEIEEFDFDMLNDHFDPTWFATETVNFSLKNGNPKKYIFVATDMAFMKINGSYETFEKKKTGSYGVGPIRWEYFNDKFKLTVTGICKDKPNAVMDGEVECEGSLLIVNKQNGASKTVNYNSAIN